MQEPDNTKVTEEPEAQEDGVNKDVADEGQEGTADDQTESTEEAGDDATSDEGESSETDGDDDLPSWAREKLTKANAEAANYRTRLREAEEKLKNAKSTDEVDEIVKQLQADREKVERDLLVENVALKHRLPEKLQARLKGNTREELEADAKELADLFGAGSDDEDIHLEGGMAPRGRGGETSGDPRDLAGKYGPRSSKKRR